MNKSWLENLIAGSYALALHIIVVVLLVLGVDSESTMVTAPAAINIVQATVMDELQVLEDIAQRKERFEEKKVEEDARLAALEKKAAEDKAALEREVLERENEKLRAEKEKQHLVELEKQKKVAEKKKQEVEAKRKSKVEQQRIAEAEKAAVLKQKKIEQEKQRKMEQERQAAEEKKAAELKQKKQDAEKKRKAEEAKILKAEKERKAAEERKRAAAEKQRLADEEKRKREEANRLLQDSLAAEEREREESRISAVVNQHMGMIRQRIKRYWSEPANAGQGLQCTLRVSLLPNGDVKKVSIEKSSGNAIFDRSAESAVYKAAPWRQPSDPKAAEELRNFQFIFRPK